MLKITVDTVKTGIVIKLEGRLAGPWVQELEKYWESIRVVNESNRARVDLQGVTHVDECGKQLLKQIYRQGGVLIASGCMTKAIVQEIIVEKTCEWK
ncbi:MAG: hypothetical protein NPIRA02_36040 [Nitrospirales bacterium]|nr:MAG: hypothetical protein NPIRA02_36040 [Nitrospirales bacterium]